MALYKCVYYYYYCCCYYYYIARCVSYCRWVNKSTRWDVAVTKCRWQHAFHDVSSRTADTLPATPPSARWDRPTWHPIRPLVKLYILSLVGLNCSLSASVQFVHCESCHFSWCAVHKPSHSCMSSAVVHFSLLRYSSESTFARLWSLNGWHIVGFNGLLK